MKINISCTKEWPFQKIRNICTVVTRGTAPVYSDYSSILAIGQRCVREGGFVQSEARFHDERFTNRVLRPQPGDVLLTSTGTGTIGRSCVFNEDGNFIVDGHVTVLRSDPKKLDGRWLNCVLQSPEGHVSLESHCYSGSTNQVELSRERLIELTIPVPPLNEQRRISEILDTIDEAIQKTEALIEKLKAMKQGLLHDLLTRGLDENEKLRDPKTHPELFKDSVLGRIPKDWKVKRAKDLCLEIVVGIVIRPAQYYRPLGVPVLRSANIKEEGVNAVDLVYMSEESNELLSKSQAHTGNVLTVRTGYPGTSCVVPHEFEGANCVDLLISRPNKEIMPEYFAIWINSDFGKTQVLRKQGGLAQQHFNVGELENLLIATPQLAEQSKILNIFQAHSARLQTELQYRNKLKLQKKGLMHDVLTGKVRVNA